MSNPLIDLFIGGMSAAVSRTCIAPLELYRLQRQNSFMPNSTIRAVIKKEGIRHLWKGNYVNCLRAFPQFSVSYAIQNYIKKYNFKYLDESKRTFISSAIGGSISIYTIYPLETIRSRLALQTNKNHYVGLFDAIKKIKFLDMYHGSSISVFGFGLYNAIIFTSYPKFKSMFSNKFGDGYLNKILCGGMTGIFAISITYPTDLIRRRLQLQGYDSHVPVYKNSFDCIKKIYQKESIYGFYRGIIVNFVKTGPMLSIQFLTIDILNDYFRKSNNNE